jgi:hypothetical protein
MFFLGAFGFGFSEIGQFIFLNSYANIARLAFGGSLIALLLILNQ